MNLFQGLFYKRKHRKMQKKYLLRILLGTAVTVICFCFASFTAWALLSDIISTGPSTLKAGVYGLKIEIFKENEAEAYKSYDFVGDEGVSIVLPQGNYDVALVADGTVSDNLAGYGKIVLENLSHYTAPMYKGDRIDFKIVVGQPIQISFYFYWGSHSGTGDIDNGVALQVIPEITIQQNSSPMQAAQSKTEPASPSTTSTTAQTSPTTTAAPTTDADKTSQTSQNASQSYTEAKSTTLSPPVNPTETAPPKPGS